MVRWQVEAAAAVMIAHYRTFRHSPLAPADIAEPAAQLALVWEQLPSSPDEPAT